VTPGAKLSTIGGFGSDVGATGATWRDREPIKITQRPQCVRSRINETFTTKRNQAA
jgi:hypothetical protein